MPLPLRKQNCFLASTGGVGILDLRDLDGSNSKKICQMHPQPSLIQSADSSDPSLFSSLQSTSTDSRGPNILLPVAYLSIPCMYAFLACQVNAWWFFCFCGLREKLLGYYHLDKKKNDCRIWSIRWPCLTWKLVDTSISRIEGCWPECRDQ